MGSEMCIRDRSPSGISGRTNSKPGYSFLRGGNLMDENTTCYITLSELKEAIDNFSKKIGKGSFGSVYGKMRDGKQITIKSMNESSCQGNQQFVNKVEFNFFPSAFSNLNSDRLEVLL